MAGNLDMALESLDVPSDLHDSMVEKFSQQQSPQIPAATTGGESPAPDANSATVTAQTQTVTTATPSDKKEEQATTEENTIPAEDLNEIDPAKKIKIGDEVLTWEQFQYRAMKKADLDKEKFRFNKEREQFELEKQSSVNAKYWQTQMENDDFARNYMTLMSSGMKQDEALETALRVVGKSLPTKDIKTESQVNSTPVIDMKSLADKLPKLPANIEPDSPDHVRWYNEVYRPAEIGLIASEAAERTAKTIEATRVAEAQKAIEAEAQKQREIQAKQSAINANQAELNKLPDMLWTMYGIDVAKLPQEQKNDIAARLSNTMTERGINPDDPQWMAGHKLDSLHIEAIVRASIPEGRNPYTNPQKSPAIPNRPEANVIQPLTAGKNYPAAATPTNGAERFSSAMEASLAALDS